MTLIKIMNESLSNKIAAGEVVERPRSIVKELVENALDAGSSFIKVSIENSGIGSITVEDDGKGMAPSDARLAFQRHATSKIFSEDDLFQIRTLGFRGEALAAIASVAKVHLYTGRENEPSTHLYLEGGKVISDEAEDARKGTKIVITQLFYNTPARLKHLRSLQTEYMHIMEYLQKMSLARPDVRFEFSSEGRVVFKTFGTGKLPETLVMIYGEKIATMLLPFSAADDDFTITGYISKPQAQRSNQRVLNISINKRSIRHFGVNRAILAGYSTLIPKGMYPIVALDIEVDTKLVDVNVHPAKLEVRLSQESQLEDLIKHAIQKALIEENLIYRDTEMPRRAKTSEQMGIHLANQANRQEDEAVEPSRTIQYPTGTGNTTSPQGSYQNIQGQDKKLSRKEQDSLLNIYQNYQHDGSNKQALPLTDKQATSYQADTQIEPTQTKDTVKTEENDLIVTSSEVQTNVETSENQIIEKEPTAVEILRELAVIGQYDATYILAQRATSLFLIDQHAAQERIKYEEHMAKVRNMETITTQELLFPLSIRVDGLEMAAIKDFKEELDKAGIYLEVFGLQDIRVEAVPTWIKTQDIESYVRKSIDILVENRSVDSALVREKELIMLSCKYSIKAHDVLSMEEMRALIYRLSEMESPFTCPHGRPIVIEHTKYEVERWFKRV